MKKPSISIITASLNQGRFIEKCILSVKNQTHPYIEHIIMDGGSTDNTLDIIKKYAGTYNLKWKSEKDRGQSHAWNKAIKIAKGYWLLFINSDDFLLGKTAIKNAFKLIKNNPGYMIYMANIKCVNERNNFLHFGSSFGHKVYTYDILMNKDAHVTHQGTIYNKKVFKKAGYYDEKYHYHMDYEYHLRISKYFDINTLNMYLSTLRIHSNAKTQLGNCKEKLEMINARLKNGGLFFDRINLFYLKKLLLNFIFPKEIKRIIKNLR